MTTTTFTAGAPAPAAAETEPIRAHGTVAKRLGHWTTARHLDIRASRGAVTLDLRSPQIAPGDIEIDLDVDHATVKLLVPEGAVIDSDEVRRVGRGRVKDWTGTAAPDGRRIVLHGELRRAEVRIHRGGVAILSAMSWAGIKSRDSAALAGEPRPCSREQLADAVQARREGRPSTINDPSR
jgi:hypothetical protein